MEILHRLSGQRTTVQDLTAGSIENLRLPTDGDESVATKLAKWRSVVPSELSQSSCDVSSARGSNFFDHRIAQVPTSSVKGATIGREWHENGFNIFMGIVVLVNTLVLAFEIDFAPKTHDADLGQLSGWTIVEIMFTCMYLVDLVLRIHFERCKWFHSLWNYLDVFLVVVALTDIMLTMFATRGSQAPSLVVLLRLARLIRLVRMTKLLYFVQGLGVVMTGACHAIKSMVWVCPLLVIGLFIFSIMATELIGQNESLHGAHPGGETVEARFGNIPRSMYSLFELLSLEGLEIVARPLVMADPALVIFFMAFIMIFPFGLVNMIVGLVIEKTLEQQDAVNNAKVKNLHDSLVNDLATLKRFFDEADINGDGTLTLEEFEAVLPATQHLLKSVGIRMKDARELYHILDWNGQGHLHVHDFLEGIARALGVTSHNCQGIATHAGVRNLLRDSSLMTNKIEELAVQQGELKAYVNVCQERQLYIKELGALIMKHSQQQYQVLQKLESLEACMENNGLMSSASSSCDKHGNKGINTCTIPGAHMGSTS